MVMHGGVDGDLGAYGRPKDYVYDWDSTQLQTKLDIGGGERMPSLEYVIMLALDAPKMQIHIEVKVPFRSEKAKARYDSLTACKLVRDLIDKYEIRERTSVIVWDPQVVANMYKVKKQRWYPKDFKILQLVNMYLEPPKIGYETQRGLEGILIHNNFLQQEFIEKNHAIGQGKLVGIWCTTLKGKVKEADEAAMYDKLFGKTGKRVDFFYSDHPSKAMKARDKI